MTKYVKAKYFKPQYNGYSGMAYIFSTSLPLSAGDKVILPSGKNSQEQRGIIVDADVPTSEINPAWDIKPITAYYTEDGNG